MSRYILRKSSDAPYQPWHVLIQACATSVQLCIGVMEIQGWKGLESSIFLICCLLQGSLYVSIMLARNCGQLDKKKQMHSKLCITVSFCSAQLSTQLTGLSPEAAQHKSTLSYPLPATLYRLIRTAVILLSFCHCSTNTKMTLSGGELNPALFASTKLFSWSHIIEEDIVSFEF